ncbi:Frataxin [Penicillium verhagenii]|uniref:Frataxin n=1 Tax=Penicillium verhagenii TaxID=1562060 RepID=UPI00254505AD|nr:Frataxin [Penicillium verhagenii]KAJ5935159.1 Frataxin [Penicillium verhagenii]
MLSRSAPRLLRLASRTVHPNPLTTPQSRPALAFALRRSSQLPSRPFHASATRAKGIQPDSENPRPPNTPVAGAASHVTEPSSLTPEEYHDYSEHYFNVLIAELEKAQEEGSDVEAEYSAGVLNITIPAIGSYVLNKQPPNRQIWLSSPISGPKRFDWVLEGDRMHEKQDTREFSHGQWIYLRDGSNLTEILNGEMSLALPKDIYGVLLDD